MAKKPYRMIAVEANKGKTNYQQSECKRYNEDVDGLEHVKANMTFAELHALNEGLYRLEYLRLHSLGKAKSESSMLKNTIKGDAELQAQIQALLQAKGLNIDISKLR